jgi:hypothetical protein
MKRVLFLASVAFAFGVGSSEAAAPGFTPPRWLRSAEHTALRQTFENAKPIRVYSIPYPKKIAVIFEFDHVVICGACGGPTEASTPRGRVIRVSFVRATHALGGAPHGWAMRFCESVGRRPPKSDCLRR